MLLSAEHLWVNFGRKQLLEDVSLYLEPGARVGVVGVNGTGKSTLLRILAGALQPDSGTVSTDPGVRVRYLPQSPRMEGDLSVLDYVMQQLAESGDTCDEYEAKRMLSHFGIVEYTAPLSALSGGQCKRAALAAVLLQEADVLLLDEPTNHLDADTVMDLESRLQRFSGALVMVTHDRYFLERVCNHMVELSQRKLYHYEANYSRFLELKLQRAEMAEAAERRRQSILRTEYQWVMRGAQARRTKNKDRLERYEDLRARHGPEYEGAVRVAAVSGRLGREIADWDNVSFAWGDRTVLRNFTYSVTRTDRIGIVGPNGAGKTTLLNLLAGTLQPDAGAVHVGQTVRIGYFTQTARQLDGTMRVSEYAREMAARGRSAQFDAGGYGRQRVDISPSAMMERFLFPPEMHSQLIADLSGGERRRLFLLGILLSAPNLLLLDEPTNDLDISTLSALEEYLDEFEGPVIAVAHDRYFLDKIAEQIFELPGDGSVYRYSGSFSDYLAKRPVRPAAVPRTEPQSGTSTAAPPARQRSEPKLRISYKEQREYETIESDIASLEAKLSENAAQQRLYCSDYVRLQTLTAEADALDAELEAKMERWDYLTDLVARIEASKNK